MTIEALRVVQTGVIPDAMVNGSAWKEYIVTAMKSRKVLLTAMQTSENTSVVEFETK